MEAPKKLFIKPEKITVEMIPGGELPNVGIQYIRKDALLEWAKEKNKRIDTEDGDYSLGYVSAMIDLIDKIETL